MAMYALTKEPNDIRPLEADEIPAALSLAWEVFSEYEAPVYSAEGTEEFRKCLNDEAYLSGIEFYGAFESEKLIGVVGIRGEAKHICFFFCNWTKESKYNRESSSLRRYNVVAAKQRRA